jgi:hypothetical protein
MEHFVVRLWVASEGSGLAADFRGTVQHVRTGAEETFASEQELLSFLRREVSAAVAERGPIKELPETGGTM